MLTLKNATKTALLEVYARVLRMDPSVDEEHYQAFTDAAEEATVEQLYSVLIDRASWDKDCAEAIKQYPKVVGEKETTMNTKNTIATKNTKTTKNTKKEETKMSKNTKNTKSAETKAPEISKKDQFATAVDTWLEHFKTECEGNGYEVIIKTWEKIPTCRALRVDNVTYFEIYYSSRGVRLCAKSKLIPEDIRPEGATIIKNGLDLCIPTFTEVAENLTKYADACRKSLADAKAEKEKEKAEKEAKRKEKAAETKNAAK